MGKRGPKPQPTALKLVRGNPGKRPINEDEPKPDSGIPDCPEWIPDSARESWFQVAPMLHRMGVLTKIDGQALTRYCVLHSRWVAAEKFIAKFGMTYQIKGDNGDVKCIMQLPQVNIAAKLAVILGRIEAEFGMTPASRTGIKTESGHESDELDDFLNSKAGA